MRSLALAVVAIVFLSAPAHSAGIPLVTGKCGCAIGGGLFLANCGGKRGICTRAQCARACQAAVPSKPGA